MLNRLICAAAVVTAMLIPALTPLVQAQAVPFFQIPLIRLPGAGAVKFPEVAGFGNVVSIAGNADASSALFWEKVDTSTAVAGPGRLGNAEGNPDYATASVEYADDGTLYYVWSDFDNRRLNIRVRKPGQDFGPTMLVTGASAFPSDPDVAVTDGPGGRVVLVVWRESDGDLLYRFSQTDGATWSGTGLVAESSFPEFSVYGGPNGALAVGYTRAGGQSLQAYVQFWNGSGFNARERISPGGSGGFAEPTLAQQPDGSYVAVYRGIDRNANFGTYIAGRNPDGTWSNVAPFGRIDRGDIGSTWLDIDPLGNWHLFWSGTPTRGGGLNVYYARAHRSGSQISFTPVIASGGAAAGGVYNIDGALTVRDNVYAHVVYERFEGDSSRPGYSMVNSPGSLPDVEAIRIEENAAFTNKPNVRVDFVNPRNAPTQVRYRWGSAPDDGDAPVPFANPLIVPLPPNLDPAACTPLTLYTQLINAAGRQIGASSDQIKIDRAAQASASIAAAQPGPDPSFTRATGATVTVRDAGECAGLASASVSGGTAQATIPLTGQTAGSATITLPGGDGRKTITVVASDVLGNSREIPLSLTVDTVAPDLDDAGSVSLTPDARYNGIVEVALSGASVTEANLYGIQVTTRYTPQGGGAAVTGAPQIVPATLRGGALRFSYSVASGLPIGTARAGAYQFTIRFVDRAGNVSAGSTVGSVTFSGNPAFPRLYLPYVTR